MRVLIITHGYPPRDRGGSQLYAEAHAEALAAAGDAVLVLTREADPARPEFAVRRESRPACDVVWVNNTFAALRSPADSYTDERIDRVALEAVDAFGPDVAHVHHLTCLSTTLVPALADRGVPVFVTLHDYWLICHRGQLLDTSLQRCDGPEHGGCGGCLGAAGAAPPAAFALRRAGVRMLRAVSPAHAVARAVRAGALALGAGARVVTRAPAADAARRASWARVEHMRAIAGHVTRFFAPSGFVRDRFVAFGLPPDRITVSEYGWRLPPLRPDEARQHADPGVALQAGFIGSLMVSKAPHLLIEAAGRLAEGTIRVHLYGEVVAYHGDDAYARVLAPLVARPYVIRHGPLDRAQLRRALAGLHVVVVPSIWDEASPLVIREAFLAGVPVVAARVGGIPETVSDGVNGLLVEPGDIGALQRALARLVAEPGLLPRLRAGIPAVRTVADDVEAMRRHYARAVPAPTGPGPTPLSGRRRVVDAGRSSDGERVALAPAPASPPVLAAIVVNHRTPDETFLAVRSLLLSRRPVDHVIVVDNDADASCREVLAPLADRVTLQLTGRNLGFSGGVNVGLREALARGADRLLLVNSDVVVPVTAIAGLERALEGTTGAGLAAPVVVDRARPEIVATAGMRYDPRTGRMRHPDAGRPLAEGGRGGLVDGASGCCVLIRREVIEAVGEFDERYFFGFEDLDLCLRARDAGWVTVVAADVTVLHAGGRTIGATSPVRLYYAARNHLRLAERHGAAGPVARLSRAAAVVGWNAAHALRAGGGSAPQRLAAVTRGVFDHARGRYGPERR